MSTLPLIAAQDVSVALTQNKLASLSFAELRDRLTVCAEVPTNANDLDPVEALHYLQALPISSHTSDSAEALLQITRIVVPKVGPAEMLQSSLLASKIAKSLDDRLLLGRARYKQGIALTRLGRFAEATAAQTETWSLARDLENKDLELNAVWGFSSIFVAMGQWDAAIRCCERMRAIAEELGLARYEFIARNNLADCALQLRDVALASPTLLKLVADAPHTDIEPNTHTHLHNNLTRSWLLVGDIARADFHVKQAAQWAAVWGAPHVLHCVEALQGLVDIRLGMVDKGLSAVNHALNFAKRDNRTEVPDCLGICIDAYEAAGHLDEALAYLHELVEWKKKSVDADLTACALEAPTEPIQLQTGSSLLDDGLLAKVQSLQVGTKSRVERLLEIAINAEIASGHDLYRPFRIASLARYLATALSWDQQRIIPLILGAQLCNIGMIAVPARILFKPGTLSEVETRVVRAHTEYGAELLRKSKLQMLNIAAVIAEQHHECYNGTGYPANLNGEAITEEARLVAICNAFDAMTHKRPWRKTPLSARAALNELKRAANSQFDPQCVDAFVQMFTAELSHHEDLDAYLAQGAGKHEYVSARARVERFLADAP